MDRTRHVVCVGGRRVIASTRDMKNLMVIEAGHKIALTASDLRDGPVLRQPIHLGLRASGDFLSGF